MQRFRLFFVIFLGATPLLSHAGMDSVPVIGLDEEGNEAVVALPREQFHEHFKRVLGAVQDSTLHSLQNWEHQGVKTPSRWLLRDVTVGVGLNLTAGLGAVYHVSAAPRIRACFSNSTHPRFQD